MRVVCGKRKFWRGPGDHIDFHPLRQHQRRIVEDEAADVIRANDRGRRLEVLELRVEGIHVDRQFAVEPLGLDAEFGIDHSLGLDDRQHATRGPDRRRLVALRVGGVEHDVGGRVILQCKLARPILLFGRRACGRNDGATEDKAWVRRREIGRRHLVVRPAAADDRRQLIRQVEIALAKKGCGLRRGGIVAAGADRAIIGWREGRYAFRSALQLIGFDFLVEQIGADNIIEETADG